ncbi:MAG: terminase family protein [Sphingopyxis sp.]|nr:terminase family protein [Sphingopyxis sp.]
MMPRAMWSRVAASWRMHARPEQLPPPGDWRIWLMLAGRGFGKTRAGAEWINAVARTHPQARIALVGATIDDVRQVMIEGESGILNLNGAGPRPIFNPALRRLLWPDSGAMATIYSAAEPERLRGPQHHFAWGDEVARWGLSTQDGGARGGAAWDNLMLGLRLGSNPRVLATTTPRAVPLVKRLIATRGVVVSGGATGDNAANLPAAYIDAMTRLYGGTALGRQELGGELIADIPGALWTRAGIEACRCDAALFGAGDDAPGVLARVVIGVDPPASDRGDACGIVVAGEVAGDWARGDGEALRWVILDDRTVERPSPERWAKAVADAARDWRADRIVAEANNGGDMVRSVLRAADATLPVALVHASRGKAARAEPIAFAYARGEVGHAGVFARLEDELCALVPGTGHGAAAFAGGARSPDRADAAIWALTELMQRAARSPSVRML